jgi:hypothetical protein
MQILIRFSIVIGTLSGMIGMFTVLWYFMTSPRVRNYNTSSGTHNWYWAVRDPFYWSSYLLAVLTLCWILRVATCAQ